MRPGAYLLPFLLIPLLVVLLAGTAEAKTAITQPLVAGQRALVEQPARPTDRVVLYVHGAGETTATIQADPYKAPLFARLLRDGYTIAATNAHGDNWGTDRSVRDYVSLVRWLHRQGLTRVHVLAQSMGGMDALQLIGRMRPVAWAGIFPACNLRAESVVPRLIPGITAAHPYGLPAHLSPVRPTGVRGLRMLFWASYADTIVPRAANTDMCASYARRHGARVQIVTTTGDHGDPSNVQPNRLAAFYTSA